MLVIEKVAKVAEKYTCSICDYNTSVKYNFTKHLSTGKHLKNAFGDDSVIVGDIKSSKYICSNCDKEYNSNNGLWCHKKKCKVVNTVLSNYNQLNPNEDTNGILTNAIVSLITQNNELRNLILEQNKQTLELTTQTITDISKHITTELINAVKTGGIGTNNTIMNNSNNNNTLTNNNSHNTTFNLHFFLNETCKDALNINEFIQNIKVSNEDLEETARLGYSGGISRIFINELNQLDITKKPIHCSDAKRETVYIKENDIWEKDDEEKTRLTNAIKQTARKNIQQIFEWEKLHPICKTDPDSRYGRLYNKIILNSMSGGTIEEQVLNINKVIKNIVKHVVIDKQLMIT